MDRKVRKSKKKRKEIEGGIVLARKQVRTGGNLTAGHGEDNDRGMKRKVGEDKTHNYQDLVLSLYFFGSVSSFYLHSDFRLKVTKLLRKEKQGWVELLERVGFDVLYRMVNEPRLPPQLSVSIYPRTRPHHPHTYPHAHTHTRTGNKRKNDKAKNTQHKKGRQKEVIFLTCRHPKQNVASMEFQITFSVSTIVQKGGGFGSFVMFGLVF
jgi:hypothetical protein